MLRNPERRAALIAAVAAALGAALFGYGVANATRAPWASDPGLGSASAPWPSREPVGEGEP